MSSNPTKMFDKVFVIGLGGTGGRLAEPLATMIANHPKTSNSTILFFDGDDFEEKNKTRQLMNPNDVNKNKAESVARFCETQGYRNITPINDYVTEETITPFLNGSESPLIIATVDNDPSRAAIISAIEKTCQQKNKDFLFLTPGNSDGSGEIKGQVLWFGCIGGKPCGMNPKTYDQDIANPSGQIPRQGGCTEMQTTRPQLISANFLAAAITLTIIQSVLDESLNPNLGQFYFNGTTLKTTIS